MILQNEKVKVEPFSLKAYVWLTGAVTPLLWASQPLLRLYGGFKDTVPERLGRFPAMLDELEAERKDKPLVWIHAVSVGEAAIAGCIVDEIRKRRADALVALSTTTFNFPSKFTS